MLVFAIGLAQKTKTLSLEMLSIRFFPVLHIVSLFIFSVLEIASHMG